MVAAMTYRAVPGGFGGLAKAPLSVSGNNQKLNLHIQKGEAA